MATERMFMNQPYTSSGTLPSAARAAGSSRVRGIFSRLTSRSTAGVKTSAHRSAAWFAWGLWALSVLFILGYIPLRYQWYAVAPAKGATLSLQDIAVLKDSVPQVVADVLAHAAYLIYSTLGALIVSRARERRIGWLFCTIGLLFASIDFTGVYAVYTLLVAPGALPGGLVAAWMQGWMWMVAWSLAVVYLPLLYPTGRLVSRRWKPVAYFAAGLIAVESCLNAIYPGPLGNYFVDFQVTIPNPLGIAALGPVAEVILPIGLVLLLLLAAVSATSLLLRLRRATGDERAQLKWFAYIAAFLVVLFVANNLLPIVFPLRRVAMEAAIGLVTALAGGSLPLLTGLAILKYHLYAIDRLINRTLVYGALTASVVGLYVVTVGALGALVRSSEVTIQVAA